LSNYMVNCLQKTRVPKSNLCHSFGQSTRANSMKWISYYLILCSCCLVPVVNNPNFVQKSNDLNLCPMIRFVVFQSRINLWIYEFSFRNVVILLKRNQPTSRPEIPGDKINIFNTCTKTRIMFWVEFEANLFI